MRKFIQAVLVKAGLIPKVDYIVSIRQKIPADNDVSSNEIVVVKDGRYLKWVCMHCPCGRSGVVRLSLNAKYTPHWSISSDIFGRPTIHPSIWKKDECQCHFWLRDGKIVYA